MTRTAALLLSTAIASAAAEPRYARLGELGGAVEVRVNSASEWKAALRNLPLAQGFRIRTGAASRAEMEFDDGSVLRLGPDSSAEICDHVRLSTGQRISLLALEHGLAYFTGVPGPKDSLSVAIPGGQVALRGGARLRLEAAGDTGQVALLEGEARVLLAVAEFDIREGHTARLNAAQRSRFELYREALKMDLDGWNEERDRTLASTRSAIHAPTLQHGLADLDENGTWIETAEFGPAWKPAAQAGWMPFRNGKWIWYDGLGYTWVSAEPWGWLPYHYGRWTRIEPIGWIWAPGRNALFSPGEVYWMRGPNMAGWGPLSAGENWNGTAVPQLYLNAHTTFAKFQTGMREIDPGGFAARPKDPLAAAQFTRALASPPLIIPRPESETPRAAEVRFLRSDPKYEVVSAPPEPAPEPQPEQPVAQAPPQPAPEPQPAQPQGYVSVPVPQYEDTYYTVPVYTGVIVVNPPERHDSKNHKPRESAKPAQPPTPAAPATPAAPQPPGPRQGIPRVDRNEAPRTPETRSTQPPASQPIPRGESQVPRSEPGSSGRRQQ